MERIKNFNQYKRDLFIDEKMRESIEGDLKIFDEYFAPNDDDKNINSIFILDTKEDYEKCQKILQDLLCDTNVTFKDDRYEYCDNFDKYVKACYVIDDCGDGILVFINKEIAPENMIEEANKTE